MRSGQLAGYFMLATAIIVAVPVLLQMRAREADWKHVWSPLLFVCGLAITGAGYVFAAPQNQTSIAVAGVAAMLIGLFFAQKSRDSHRRS